MYIQRIWNLKIWKKKPFCMAAVLFFLMILFCLIKIALPCQTYSYEGSMFFNPDSPVGDTAVYGGIRLKPGVYRIELEYDTDTDLAALCHVADGTVFYGGLRSNGEHLYSGLPMTGFDIWLYEEAKDLQILVSYGGKGSLVTGSLRIVETNQLWTMMLVLVLTAGLAVCIFMIFCYYDKVYPVPMGKKHAFFWVTVIALAASLPSLCGYNIAGADLTYHLQRIEGVKDALVQGQFPVRMEPKWLYGHGYANGIFYCNTFLYFPALLRLLGFPVSASYNAYCIMLNFAAAWISYVCFGRIFKKHNIGILCSALYTLSVFRIYKLIITSATGEGTAVTFIPLVLYGLYRVFGEDPQQKRYKTSWVPLTLGIAGLIQSHMLTCEITAVVIAVFCIIFIRKIFEGRVFLALFRAALCSLLLSLWFIVPFLDYYLTQDVHIRHVSARTIQDRGLYLAHLAFHFWSRGVNTPTGDNGMQYSHPVGIGLILVAVLAVFLILWFSGAFRKVEFRGLFFVKAAAGGGTALLIMSMHIFPWDRIQDLHPVLASLVSSLQFPNRFLGWGTACLVLVFGFCMWYFQVRGGKYGYLAVAAAGVICVTTSGMYLLDYVNSGEDYFVLYNEESMGFGYISGAEYLIEGTEEGKLTYASPQTGEGVELSAYEKKGLRVRMQCVNRAVGDSYVDLPLLLYKGYRAVCGDTGQALQVCTGENNLVRVLLPAGFEGNVEVGFSSPLYWRISELLTALTVLGLLLMWCVVRRREYVEREK